MKPLFAFIISAIMLVALAVAFPEVLLTPGSLLKGHHDVEKNCLNCHTPFRGVKSVTCTNCHKQNDISVKTVSGTLLQKNSKKILFHQGLSSGSCIECHTDHKGINALKALKPFKHSILSSSLRNSCVSCHSNQKPEDKLHRSLQGSCAECHNTNKWKPASFNHRKLSTSNQCLECHKSDKPNDKLHLTITAGCAECHNTNKWKPASFNHRKLSSSAQCLECHKSDKPNDKLHLKFTAGCAECHNTNKWKPASFNHRKLSTSNQCLECHKSDKPNDKLHLTITAGCTECHNTNKWKPASFNHNKYFKLDRDHSASCAKCHTDPNNYKTYTCYNCHEHSPSKIAAEHRKERISNYQNCIKCHRSSSEREREHEGRGNDD